jgi:hypothetical protein
MMVVMVMVMMGRQPGAILLGGGSGGVGSSDGSKSGDSCGAVWVYSVGQCDVGIVFPLEHVLLGVARGLVAELVQVHAVGVLTRLVLEVV